MNLIDWYLFVDTILDRLRIVRLNRTKTCTIYAYYMLVLD